MENKDLLSALLFTQGQIIGFFTNPYTNIIECVYHSDEDMFTTLSIGNLLGLNENHYPHSQFFFISFPENKSLKDMMNKPLKFGKWYNDNMPRPIK